MRAADCQHIGVRVGQERVHEFRNLFAIADEVGKVEGKLPYDARVIHTCRDYGSEYAVKDIVDRVAECIFCSVVESLRQLCSEFRRFGGVAGERFGLVIQSCVTNAGEELPGLCQQ